MELDGEEVQDDDVDWLLWVSATGSAIFTAALIREPKRLSIEGHETRTRPNRMLNMPGP